MPDKAKLSIFSWWVDDIAPVVQVDPSTRAIALCRRPQHTPAAGILVTYPSAMPSWTDKEVLDGKYINFVRNEISNNHIHQCAPASKD